MKDFMANAINIETSKDTAWPFPKGEKVVKTKLTSWDYPGIFGYEDENLSVSTTEALLKEELSKKLKSKNALVGELDLIEKYVRDSMSKEADPSGKPLNTAGAKADAGKPRPWLMFKGFSRALEEVSKVTSIGAVKYTPNGWATVENGEERYMDAFMRHLFPVARGDRLDNGEGGIGTLHLAQVIWNLLATLELELRKEQYQCKNE